MHATRATVYVTQIAIEAHTFTLIYPAGAVGAVAGALLGAIVVVTCVGIIIIIWRYRLSTHCCVNTLSISVLRLCFTFTTQTKTKRNDVIP